MIRRDDADSSNRMIHSWPHTLKDTPSATSKPLPALPTGVSLYKSHHPTASHHHIIFIIWLTCSSMLPLLKMASRAGLQLCFKYPPHSFGGQRNGCHKQRLLVVSAHCTQGKDKPHLAKDMSSVPRFSVCTTDPPNYLRSDHRVHRNGSSRSQFFRNVCC